MFSHITTSILAICNYLKRNPSPRDKVNDVNVFRHYTEKHHAKLSNKAEIAYKKKVNNGTLTPLHKHATIFLAGVEWSEDDFLSAYAACFSIMGETQLTEKERLSKDLLQRILAMSGLSWNTDSKNRGRDWERYAVAATGEAALVQLHRKKLLTGCAPARALRKDLYDLFLSWAADRAEIPTGGQSGLQIVRRWEFADDINLSDIPDSEIDEQRPDLEKMRVDWDASIAAGKASKKVVKQPKDSIDAMLEGLKSNKFLHCSNQDASLGTLESLSAFAISILGHVMRKTLSF